METSNPLVILLYVCVVFVFIISVCLLYVTNPPSVTAMSNWEIKKSSWEIKSPDVLEFTHVMKSPNTLMMSLDNDLSVRTHNGEHGY